MDNHIDCFCKLNPERQPLVYIKKSKIPGAGNGLYALKNIKKNTPICIYFGDLVNVEELLSIYLKDKNLYIKKIAPYLRDSNIEGYKVNGIVAKEIDNLNLKGYLVNDINSIDLARGNLKELINKYKKSKIHTNVIIVETEDFPIYYSLRDIEKDEELYTHYGIAYWLLLNNIKAENIAEIIKNN